MKSAALSLDMETPCSVMLLAWPFHIIEMIVLPAGFGHELPQGGHVADARAAQVDQVRALVLAKRLAADFAGGEHRRVEVDVDLVVQQGGTRSARVLAAPLPSLASHWPFTVPATGLTLMSPSRSLKGVPMKPYTTPPETPTT